MVGWGNSASGREAFRWEDLNGNGRIDPDERLDNHPEFGLGDLPEGGFYSESYGVSADGSVVVGWGNSASGFEAFRWTSTGGMVGLGDLLGGIFESRAYDVSADGSVVVGHCNSAFGEEAFIWDETNGMRNLKDVLQNDYGLDLTGWRLMGARGISDDGLTIVGSGVNPDGHTEAWIATLSAPPCWQEQVKLTASDAAAYDVFGAVGISGNTAIVGAPLNDDDGSESGAAYLFNVVTGKQLAKLTANDAAAYDWFGYAAVAISGDTAIVGAFGDDNAGTDSGSAYLFDVSDPNNPIQTYKLTASDAAAGDHFGAGVAISGDTAIVGAYGTDNAGSWSGSAYLFDVVTGRQLAKLTADDASAEDFFGYFAVAISGDTAIVGAYRDDDDGTNSGSAYLFDVSDPNNPIQTHKLTALNAAVGDEFGLAVAISGNTAIVGAHYDDDTGTNSGSAYLFDINTGSQLAKLAASDAAAYDEFGVRVAISGNTAVVGAVEDDDAGTNSGSAYLFDVATGVQIAKLTASDAATGDRFGGYVAISGNTAIVGAIGDDDAGSDSGSAYIFQNICNTEPVANAGENIQIASVQQASTIIQGAAIDPDGDAMEYRWLEGDQVLFDWSAVDSNGNADLDLGAMPYFSIGNHTLRLEVTDCKVTTSDEMVLTIQNSPPEVQAAPKHQIVEVGVDLIVVVGDAGDFDGDTLSYQWLDDSNNVLASGNVSTTPGGNPVPIPEINISAGDTRFEVGTHAIRLQVSDGINEPVSDLVTVEVIDTTAPSISPVPSVTILWPPNHELIPVTIQANAFDNGGGDIILSVTVQSSEPADTIGDGNTSVDYYIDSVDNETGVIELRLRSERSGKGSGRVYTITITATDDNQNQSQAVVQIRAPHDRSKK